MLKRGLPLFLLLVLWATRVTALEALPLHNDEGLHLTRALEVWNGHPFWAIGDGKIINHWPIALFYPQKAPVFIGRIPTVILAVIGLAAGYRLIEHLFGTVSAVLASGLWIASPYLFFYERLAFSDAEAGSLVVVALLASFRLAQRGRKRDALLAGLLLALAMLFKFTAVPFALAMLIVMLLVGNVSWPTRGRNLAIVALTIFVCFLPPLIYLLARGQGLFGVALDWLGGASGASVGASARPIGSTLGDNLSRLWAQLTGFGVPIWTIFLLLGLLLLLLLRPRLGRVLLLSLFVPLFLIVFFGREVLPRHFVVAVPLALILAGAGLGIAIRRMTNQRLEGLVSGAVFALLLVGFIPFAMNAYLEPGTLPLPQLERAQFITEHSSGFGLREAVRTFPEAITHPDVPIIASMFPDSCKRANFYALDGLVMRCPPAPGRVEIEAALADSGAVYVLVDTPPVIGLDVTTLDARATRIAAYPRPGETDDTATVVLWLLERPS